MTKEQILDILEKAQAYCHQECGHLLYWAFPPGELVIWEDNLNGIVAERRLVLDLLLEAKTDEPLWYELERLHEDLLADDLANMPCSETVH